MQWFEHYLKGPGGAPPPPEIDPRKLLGLDAADAGAGRGRLAVAWRSASGEAKPIGPDEAERRAIR